MQNAMLRKKHTYWDDRILAQISCLEEYVSAYGTTKYDALLETVTAMSKEAFDRDGAITPERGQEIEALLAEASGDLKALTVSCLAHAHIDMNWMWRFDETVSVTIDTFRTMLDLMREYPDFTFSQSQASVYKIIEEFAPEMLDEIRQRIREKRWEVVASTWVEPDKNMPSAESLARHILYTREYLKGLLGLTDSDFQIDFEPDTFGHNINVPEILNQGGVRYYYHCRGYNGHHLYRWRSPSGAQITVFRDPTWYMDMIDSSSFLYIPSFCAKNKLDRMIHVYGVGDHGGGATRRDLNRILDMNTWPCYPTLKFGRYIDFFHYMDTLDLPVIEGERNFIFSGCYTTQTRIKKANRMAEASLNEAEALNAVSDLCGSYKYSPEAFASAWQNVLFNHFHDILPGSGVIDTREYALGMFQRTMAVAGVRKSSAVRGIASKINTAALLAADENDTDSISEGAGVGFGVGNFEFTLSNATRGSSRLFHIFTTSQTAVTECSTITVWDWDGSLEHICITDEEGAPAPFQLLDTKPQVFWGHRYFRVLVEVRVEPFGYRTILLAPDEERTSLSMPNDPRSDTPPSYILENDQIRAVFDVHHAGLISLTDKATGKEFIDASRIGGVFRCIDEDDSAGMTAWTVGRYMSVTPLIENVRITSGVSGQLRQSFSYEIPFASSRLSVTVSLDRNSRTLEYQVNCEWREFGVPGKRIPQLNFSVPLAFDCPRYQYDVPLAVIERDSREYDVPGLSFGYAPREADSGLMLVSDCKYGFRGFDNALALTLIRSSYDPDSVPECYDHSFRFGIGLCNQADPKSLLELSYHFCHPTITLAARSQEGPLPLKGSFLGLDSDSILLSAVKMAQDGSRDVIVRVFNTSGDSQTALLSPMHTPLSVCFTDLHEHETAAGNCCVEGEKIRFTLPPFASATLRICF